MANTVGGNGSYPGSGGGGGGPVTVADPISANQASVTAPGTTGIEGLAVQPMTGGLPFNVVGVFWQSTQPIFAASLPLPAGASTAAKQPALGTAGSPSTDVLSVQGAPSMTALKTDGSSVTQPVSLATIPALVASTASIGQVGGKTAKISVSPTVTAAAYATGNVVGGKITFTSALLVAGSGVLESIWLKIKTVQTATFQLSLFDSNPTNSTWTDKAAPAINVADIPFLIGTWSLGAASSVLGTETIYTLDAIGHAISAGATTLYGILTVTGTPTFGSTSDVTISLGVLQD